MLERNPECFDSLDVLDDLATAVLLHGQADHTPLVERLLRPLLERAAAIVEATRATANPPPRLPWLTNDNRPPLRSLFRHYELIDDAGDAAATARCAANLLEINLDDNHGLRYELAPQVVPYLLDKRIARPKLHDMGVGLDGLDRGWYYRQAMRYEWTRTPGALAWAAKLLR